MTGPSRCACGAEALVHANTRGYFVSCTDCGEGQDGYFADRASAEWAWAARWPPSWEPWMVGEAAREAG